MAAPGTLVRNERTKLLANTVNSIAIAIIATGFIVSSSSTCTASPPQDYPRHA